MKGGPANSIEQRGQGFERGKTGSGTAISFDKMETTVFTAIALMPSDKARFDVVSRLTFLAFKVGTHGDFSEKVAHKNIKYLSIYQHTRNPLQCATTF